MKQQKSKSAEQDGKTQDAIALLTEDHNEVKKLFKKFEKLAENESKSPNEEKANLVKMICTELTIHTQIEEEIFYPAARGAINDDPIMDEADVEHEAVKELITQLESMTPQDDHYDAKVIVLGEQVEHHIKEEQDEMFPKVKKSRLDIEALGAELLQRKEELQDELDTGKKTTAKRIPPKKEPSSRTLHR